MIKRLLALVAVCILASCTPFKEYGEKGKINYVAAPPCYADMPVKISLLNPISKYIVHCYTTAQVSSEECALTFEGKGYVRFRDIPYKTASYDFLHRDTFPTRRWRNGERTPRW